MTPYSLLKLVILILYPFFLRIQLLQWFILIMVVFETFPKELIDSLTLLCDEFTCSNYGLGHLLKDINVLEKED